MNIKIASWIFFATIFVVIFAFDGGSKEDETAMPAGGTAAVAKPQRMAEHTYSDSPGSSAWADGASDDWFAFDNAGDNDDNEIAVGEYQSASTGFFDEGDDAAPIGRLAVATYADVPVRSGRSPSAFAGQPFDPRLRVHFQR